MISGMHLTPLGDGSVLLEPADGLDPSDPDAYLVPVLTYLAERHARRLIYDLDGVAVVDRLYYRWLCELASVCRVAGVELIAVNLRPEAAYAMALELDHAPPFRFVRDVDRARDG